MFDWVLDLFRIKKPKPAAELDMSQWGMGDPSVTIKDGGPNFPMGVDAQDHGLGELEWKNMRQAPNELRISVAARPDDPKGGYGGPCIPDGTVLPGTIDGEPTPAQPRTQTLQLPRPALDAIGGDVSLYKRNVERTPRSSFRILPHARRRTR